MLDPDDQAAVAVDGFAKFDDTLGARPNHQSLKEMASDFIRKNVVSGRLGPGAKVDQDEIAGALGISRLPVREALIELASKGFVESIPRRGAFVVKLTVQDIEDHFEVIGLLFALTARRAAKGITDKQIQALQQLHHDTTSTQDPAKRLQMSFEFYRLVNRIGTSDRLLLTLRFLALALPNDFYFSTARWPATETVYRERIIAALENHDVEAAITATDEHLRICAKVTIDELRARGYWSDADEVTEVAS